MKPIKLRKDEKIEVTHLIDVNSGKHIRKVKRIRKQKQALEKKE